MHTNYECLAFFSYSGDIANRATPLFQRARLVAERVNCINVEQIYEKLY